MVTPRAESWKVKPSDEPRIGHVVKALDDTVRAEDLVLIGMCNDLGVRENGGRAGAAEGPSALRRALAKMSAHVLGARSLFDAGDLGAELGYDTMFGEASDLVAGALSAGAVVVMVGGGHDCAFATYRGIRLAGLEPAVVNVDAHLDVRPTHAPSSGNPFYRMLEDGLSSLTEVGLLRAINAPSHVEYARRKGATLSFFDPPATEQDQVDAAEAAFARAGARALQLSVDLDAVNQAHAPGVSWLNPVGLSAGTVRRIAWSAGRAGARALDLMELSPRNDTGTADGRDGVTARLAALLVCDLLAGLDARADSI